MRRRTLVITALVVLVLVLFAVYGVYNGVPGGEIEDGTGL
jgi:hypothetical protein